MDTEDGLKGFHVSCSLTPFPDSLLEWATDKPMRHQNARGFMWFGGSHRSFHNTKICAKKWQQSRGKEKLWAPKTALKVFMFPPRQPPFPDPLLEWATDKPMLNSLIKTIINYCDWKFDWILFYSRNIHISYFGWGWTRELQTCVYFLNKAISSQITSNS